MNLPRLFFVLLNAALLVSFSYANVEPKKVSITQIVSHPALNAVRQGVKEVLQARYPDIQIIEGDAQGTISLVIQLAQAHRAEDPDIMVTLSTVSTQAALKASKGTPVVFSAITDPVSARLIPATGISKTLTGVTDAPPFDQQIEFISSVMPKLTTMGVLYNPGEDNSVSSLASLQQVLEKKGITLLPLPVSKSSDLKQSIGLALGKVQALYVPNDNTVVSAIETAVKEALYHKLPLFSADILLVEKGCLGMIGVDYYQIGQQTGAMALKILEGRSVSEIPIENPEKFKLYLNQKTAQVLGIIFPDEMISKADQVF